MAAWKGLFLVIMLLSIRLSEANLVENFYDKSCPNVELIVRQAVAAKLSQTAATAQATLRLFFHDCFVEGCDASVMIQSVDGSDLAEKDADDNLSLAGDGFDTVVKAKQAVEASCPETVSCADVLAIATRDVVVMAGGPSFAVELGRRDGLVSNASLVAGNIPNPGFNLDELNSMFAKHNLSQTDMIALSGAHTLGVSHCSPFIGRLNSGDPSLDPDYAEKLKKDCNDSNPDFVVPMDPETPLTFDNMYYKNLVSRKGLFHSDQVLFNESMATRDVVTRFATSSGEFGKAFVVAMRKLGRAGVKTGTAGEIRKDCTKFNSVLENN